MTIALQLKWIRIKFHFALQNPKIYREVTLSRAIVAYTKLVRFQEDYIC